MAEPPYLHSNPDLCPVCRGPVDWPFDLHCHQCGREPTDLEVLELAFYGVGKQIVINMLMAKDPALMADLARRRVQRPIPA